jgi:hypothetical protein
MPFRCARGLWSKNEEPSIAEVLSDPSVRAMMARDRVDEAEMRLLLAKWSERGAREQARLRTVDGGPGGDPEPPGPVAARRPF